MAKAKHQFDIMKEIEQWFHDLLADKSLEREFNTELNIIKERHQEQSIAKDCVEEAINQVASTGLKLKHIGEILALSSSSGIKMVDQNPEREDTVTITVPTESGTDLQFTFMVLLDDDAMFRDIKVQETAQQYLKGLIFYGAAAKHKSKASKRKVIRLVIRQLDAVYK